MKDTVAKSETSDTGAAPETTAEKHPQLRKMYDALTKERETLVASIAPLREKRDKLVAQIQPLEEQLREVNQQLKAATQPKLADLDNQIGALAKTLGSRSVANG